MGMLKVFLLVTLTLCVAFSTVRADELAQPESVPPTQEELDAFATALSEVVEEYVAKGDHAESIVQQIEQVDRVLRMGEELGFSEKFSDGEVRDVSSALSLWNTLVAKLGKILLPAKPKLKVGAVINKADKFDKVLSPYSGYAVTSHGNDGWALHIPDNQVVPSRFNTECFDISDIGSTSSVWMAADGAVYIGGSFTGLNSICRTEAPWTTYDCNQLPSNAWPNEMVVIENYPVGGTDTVVVGTNSLAICVATTPFLDNMTGDNCFSPVSPLPSSSFVRDLRFMMDNDKPIIYYGGTTSGPGVCRFELPDMGDLPVTTNIATCISNSAGLTNGVHTIFLTEDRVYAREYNIPNLVTVRHEDFDNGVWESQLGLQADELFIFEETKNVLYSNDNFIGQCTAYVSLDGSLSDSTATMQCNAEYMNDGLGSGGRRIMGRNTKYGQLVYATSGLPNSFGWFLTKLGQKATTFGSMRSNFNCGQGINSVRDFYVVA